MWWYSGVSVMWCECGVSVARVWRECGVSVA